MKQPCRRLSLACTLGFAVFSTAPLFAQETTEKKIAEPVFRVSKLVGQGSAGEGPASLDEQKQVTGEAGPVEKVARAPERNEAPARLPSEMRLPGGAANATLPNASRDAAPETAVLSSAPAVAPHPLDEALTIAYRGMKEMKSNIHDYTATLVKRECVNGRVGDQEFMKIKVRNPHKGKPFSVYMKFLKPVAGREVIYVEGKNDGNLLAYEPGALTGIKTFALDPDGWMAMKGNRHPIYEAGLENLVGKLIEKAERDRAAGECEVEYREGAKINGRSCLMIQVTHPVRKAPYDFYQAQVFIDDEMQVPVRYAAYDWPTAPGEEPVLIEEYTYLKIQLNVGLTDLDFDPANKEYKFPGY